MCRSAPSASKPGNSGAGSRRPSRVQPQRRRAGQDPDAVLGPDRGVVDDPLRVVPHPVRVDHPAAGPLGDLEHRAVDEVRHAGDHGTAAARRPAARPVRRTRSRLPPIPPPATTTAWAEKVNSPTVGPVGLARRGARRSAPARRRCTVTPAASDLERRSPGAGCASGPAARPAPASANGSTSARAGAPGDVEPGHRVAVARARCSRRARPTAPAGTSGPRGSCSHDCCSPAAKCDVRLGPRRGQ